MNQKNFERKALGPLLTLKKGKKPISQSPTKEKGMQPYVDIKAFETGVIDNYTDDDKCVPCNEGDLLIVCDGSRSGYVGRAIKGYTGSTLAKISAEGVDNSYLYYFIQSMYRLLNTQMKGTGTPHLNVEVLRKAELVIPSISEQKRIVNKIEELFSELDSAVETLKKTKEQLAVYRQSVLSTAIGQSEECCQMHIEELLVKNRKGMTTGPFGTMIKKSDHRTSGHPMLGIENIGRGKFCDGNKIFVTDEKAKELEKYRVKRGDVIISRSGTVGEICEIPQRAENALISTNLIRISLDENVVLSQYFIYLFQTQGSVLKQVKELCKGSTRPFLTQGILKDIIFPIPTIKKQRQIISQIESQLTLSENIEKTINDALIQAEAMRQSILKKAFEGGL